MKLLYFLAIIFSLYAIGQGQKFLNYAKESAASVKSPASANTKVGPGLQPYINDPKYGTGPNEFDYSKCSFLPQDFLKKQMDKGKKELNDIDKDQYEIITGTIPINDVEVFSDHHIYDKYGEDESSYPRLSYWFFSKQGVSLNNTIDKNIPIILWLQGGPGAGDTAYGLSIEMGPIRSTKDSTLYYQKDAWTEFSHMIFVDQPINVGLSISPNNVYNETLQDYNIPFTKSTEDAMAVMEQFLDKLFSDETKCLNNEANPFSKLKDNPFYIFGESFAGEYVPSLTSRLLKRQKDLTTKPLPINLKGMGIGDGYTEAIAQINGYGPYMYSTGILSTYRNNFFKSFTGKATEHILEGKYKEAWNSVFAFDDGGNLPYSKNKVTQTNALNYRSYSKNYNEFIYFQN